MSERPWLKWYPGDWRSEPRLRMCSRAARSLWLDMIGLMHEAEPYGHLTVNGIAPSVKQLAAILGDNERDIAKWLGELETAGVFSRTEETTIYSRRMVRDKIKAEKDRENGRGGGNPTVKAGVNPPVKPTVEGGVKAHIPEARDLSPSGSNRRPETRERAGVRDAPAPLALPEPAPGWEAQWPKWAAFRAKIPEPKWRAFFKDARVSGEEHEIAVPSRYERDRILAEYETAMDNHFGCEVRIALSKPIREAAE